MRIYGVLYDHETKPITSPSFCLLCRVRQSTIHNPIQTQPISILKFLPRSWSPLRMGQQRNSYNRRRLSKLALTGRRRHVYEYHAQRGDNGQRHSARPTGASYNFRCYPTTELLCSSQARRRRHHLHYYQPA
jgi:hypothetical protein